MKRWTEYSVSALVAIVALSAGILSHRACTAAPATAASTAALMQTALPDSQGKVRQFKEWQGKLLVVNFWATWCPPCRAEMPILIKAQQQWGSRGVQFVGIAIDNQADVQRFAREIKANYPLLIAEEQGVGLMQALGNSSGALPWTLLIDGKGNIVQRHAGEVSAAQLQRWLTDATARRDKTRE